MDLTAEFNKDYGARKLHDGVLQIRQPSEGGTSYMNYDFNLRMLTARTGSSEGGILLIPFSQLDVEVLEAMRAKLIELKGNPPPLADCALQIPKPKTKEFGA